MQSAEQLVPELEAWLDAHTNWARRETPPTIRIVDRKEMMALASARKAKDSFHVRGMYDPDQSIIWLVRPWDADNSQDVSVLLHELVHHRQVTARHWYCPGAQELSAYRLQESWLGERGLPLNVNWVAVVLESGCSPRDIHPD